MEQLPESRLYDQGFRQEGGGLTRRAVVKESGAGEEAVSEAGENLLMSPVRVPNSDLFEIGASRPSMNDGPPASDCCARNAYMHHLT
jgi:hypothetical protein